MYAYLSINSPFIQMNIFFEQISHKAYTLNKTLAILEDLMKDENTENLNTYQ